MKHDMNTIPLSAPQGDSHGQEIALFTPQSYHHTAHSRYSSNSCWTRLRRSPPTHHPEEPVKILQSAPAPCIHTRQQELTILPR